MAPQTLQGSAGVARRLPYHRVDNGAKVRVIGGKGRQVTSRNLTATCAAALVIGATAAASAQDFADLYA